MQILTGLYLAEICMIGLFSIKEAYGAVVIMICLLVFSALVHYALNEALSPLLCSLPKTLAAEERLRRSGVDVLDAEELEDKSEEAAEAETQQPVHAVYDSDFDPGEAQMALHHGPQTSRSALIDGVGIAPEGTSRALNLTGTSLKYYFKVKMRKSPLPGIWKQLDFWTQWISPDPGTKPSMLMKFLHPEIFSDYHVLRDKIPSELLEADVDNGMVGAGLGVEVEGRVERIGGRVDRVKRVGGWVDRVEKERERERVFRDAYCPPAMRMRCPRIWLPRDRAGVSTQEVRHCIEKAGVECRDDGAWMDGRGNVVVDLNGEVGRWAEGEGAGVKF